MQEKIITVYEFNELSDKAKNSACDYAMEYFNLEDSGLDCVKEDFTTILELFGFYDIEVYYSGFYSQGDGACFTAKYYYNDNGLNKIKDYAPNSDYVSILQSMHDTMQAYKAYTPYVRINHYGRYCHENSIEINTDYTQVDTDNEALQDNFITDMENSFLSAVKSLCIELYDHLLYEYEYSHSADYIESFYTDNDSIFYADGTIYRDK